MTPPLGVARRTRLRSLLLGVTVAGATMAVVGASTAQSAPRPATPAETGGAKTAAATTSTAAPGQWVRDPDAPSHRPAGEACHFPLDSVATFDQVYQRTVSTFPDGKPRRQEFSGPLVVKFTNAKTGRSITTDLSGYGIARYRPDGGFDFEILGPAAITFHRGDSLPLGVYKLTGYHVVRFSADGTRRVIVDRGQEQNLCRAIS